MVVNGRADKAARFLCAIVERVQRVHRSNQSVARTAAYPLFLTVLIYPQEVSVSPDNLEYLRRTDDCARQTGRRESRSAKFTSQN